MPRALRGVLCASLTAALAPRGLIPMLFVRCWLRHQSFFILFRPTLNRASPIKTRAQAGAGTLRRAPQYGQPWSPEPASGAAVEVRTVAWTWQRGGRNAALLRSRWVVGSGGGGHFARPSDGPPEHPSPGYGAGYDAGLLAGLLAASQKGMPPSSPPPPPMPLVPDTVAAEGGAGAGAPEPARPPLFALLEDFPDLFQKEVLERLDPLDLTLLGRTGSAVRTAVKQSGLPRVGCSPEEPRVGIAAFCQTLSTFVWAVAHGCRWQLATTCTILANGGHLKALG